jgi:arylsulfatase A-like enzyme
MSGRYPGRFGPQCLAPSNLRAMPLGTVTLASALKSVGYRTCLSGKWHLGARPEWSPNHYGFDHSYGTLTGAADPWTHKYRKDHYEDTWHRDGKFFHEEGNVTELIAAEAQRRIEEKKGPWFIYVPFHAVHIPVDSPEEYKKLYEGVKFHDDPVKHDSRLRMAAMIAQLDAKVGQLIEALEKTGQRENTLIIFTSDNGGLKGQNNAYVSKVGPSPFNSDNTPLRGQKNTLYEGGIRVSAFANWPGKLKPGKFTVPMHAVDWFPTLASLAGYTPGNDLKWDGINQWTALTGSRPNEGERTIYIAMNGGHALRRGDWKLIIKGKTAPELFNLADDPYEKKDLSKTQPAKLQQLQKLVQEQQAKDEPNVPKDLVGLPK